jgi:hypothetical protein
MKLDEPVLLTESHFRDRRRFLFASYFTLQRSTSSINYLVLDSENLNGQLLCHSLMKEVVPFR